MQLRWRVTSVETNAIHELASSFSRVRQLPRLETINLTFYPFCFNRLGSDGRGRLALQASVLDALAGSFSVRVPPKLTSFFLHNLRTWDLHPLESPSFQTVLTTLRRLKVHVLFDRSPSVRIFDDRWGHFWSSLFPRMILAPTQHALTELTLHSDGRVGASSGLTLAGLHFPHLCALSLCHLFFQPSVGVEPFVLRHAATLAQLELLACKLPDPTDTLLSQSPSTALARDEESSSEPGGWDRIWDRFAAELTALITLHVDPKCRYVDLVSLWEIDTPESRNAADAAALRRFHMTVTARSEETRGGNPEGERGGA